MAKEEVKAEAPKVKSDRQIRWDKHVENYSKANPVKYAHKKARGEFDAIPDSFK